MDPRIVKANLLKEVLTPERCFIAENYHSADEKVSVAQARVKPGVTTLTHHLEGIEEIYIITKGKGIVNVGNIRPTKVDVGDVVIIPAGASQSITNIGKNDLVFYCICTPRFTPNCYVVDNR